MTQTRKNILSIFIILTMIVSFVGVVNVETTYAATKKPAKVTGLSVKQASFENVTISWKKAKNAKKYQVYRKIDSNKYKLIKTTTSKTLKVTQTPQKKYSYKVRGVNGKTLGPYSAVKSLTLPSLDLHTNKDVFYLSVSESDSMQLLFENEQPVESKYVTFSSQNPAIATVDKNGKIIGQDFGRTVIEAACNNNVYYADVEIIRSSITTDNLHIKLTDETNVVFSVSKNIHNVTRSIESSSICKYEFVSFKDGQVIYKLIPLKTGVTNFTVYYSKDKTVKCVIEVIVDMTEQYKKWPKCSTGIEYSSSDGLSVTVNRLSFREGEFDDWGYVQVYYTIRNTGSTLVNPGQFIIFEPNGEYIWRESIGKSLDPGSSTSGMVELWLTDISSGKYIVEYADKNANIFQPLKTALLWDVRI